MAYCQDGKQAEVIIRAIRNYDINTKDSNKSRWSILPYVKN